MPNLIQDDKASGVLTYDLPTWSVAFFPHGQELCDAWNDVLVAVDVQGTASRPRWSIQCGKPPE